MCGVAWWLWCGVVWCGVVWCGVVWCGVVWCGVVWCGVVWCGVVWYGVVWCGVVCVYVWNAITIDLNAIIYASITQGNSTYIPVTIAPSNARAIRTKSHHPTPTGQAMGKEIYNQSTTMWENQIIQSSDEV